MIVLPGNVERGTAATLNAVVMLETQRGKNIVIALVRTSGRSGRWFYSLSQKNVVSSSSFYWFNDYSFFFFVCFFSCNEKEKKEIWGKKDR